MDDAAGNEERITALQLDACSLVELADRLLHPIGCRAHRFLFGEPADQIAVVSPAQFVVAHLLQDLAAVVEGEIHQRLARQPLLQQHSAEAEIQCLHRHDAPLQQGAKQLQHPRQHQEGCRSLQRQQWHPHQPIHPQNTSAEGRVAQGSLAAGCALADVLKRREAMGQVERQLQERVQPPSTFGREAQPDPARQIAADLPDRRRCDHSHLRLQPPW